MWEDHVQVIVFMSYIKKKKKNQAEELHTPSKHLPFLKI